jgi:hypothetical protein
MGFSAIFKSSCDNGSDIRVMQFDDDLDLDHYLNPIALIVCYFIVTITAKVMLGPQVTKRDDCTGIILLVVVQLVACHPPEQCPYHTLKRHNLKR